MTLTKIINNLATIKDGKLKAGSKYDSKLITEATQGLEKLKSYNLGSKEGLNDYFKLTGDKNTNETRAVLEELQSKRYQMGQVNLGTYVTHHFDKLSEEIEEKDPLIFQYCPTQDVKNNDSYNKARKQVSDANKELKEIKENSTAYISKRLEKVDKMFIEYIIGHSDVFLQISQKEAIENGKVGIKKYGAHKFLKTMNKHYEAQAQGLEKNQKNIYEAIETKLKTAKMNWGRSLSAAEEAVITKDKRKELEALVKKYPDAPVQGDFMKDVTISAINTLMQKEAEKTAADNYNTKKQQTA